MFKRVKITALLALAAAVFGAVPLHAQNIASSILGLVTDASGAAVRGFGGVGRHLSVYHHQGPRYPEGLHDR